VKLEINQAGRGKKKKVQAGSCKKYLTARWIRRFKKNIWAQLEKIRHFCGVKHPCCVPLPSYGPPYYRSTREYASV
jgi:hypothetical protein